jgi:hypothetical protein
MPVAALESSLLKMLPTFMRRNSNVDIKTNRGLRFLQIDSLPMLVKSATARSMLRLGRLLDLSLENLAHFHANFLIRSSLRILFLSGGMVGRM